MNRQQRRTEAAKNKKCAQGKLQIEREIHVIVYGETDWQQFVIFPGIEQAIADGNVHVRTNIHLNTRESEENVQFLGNMLGVDRATTDPYATNQIIVSAIELLWNSNGLRSAKAFRHNTIVMTVLETPKTGDARHYGMRIIGSFESANQDEVPMKAIHSLHRAKSLFQRDIDNGLLKRTQFVDIILNLGS